MATATLQGLLEQIEECAKNVDKADENLRKVLLEDIVGQGFTAFGLS
ncbi:MAG: hypothetical protein RL096_570, partial [Actinomycetota bacterium]